MTMELCYNPAAGERGLGDLYLPEHPEHAPVALTIHGGGWSAQDKSSFCGVSQFIASLGWAVFNINYRLTTIAPWPACGDDCLMAAKFLLDGEVPEFAGLDRCKLLICGGSAGGHLALMTGLRLPPNRVAGIISISGIDELTSDFALHSFRYEPFFGGEPTEEKQTEANPILRRSCSPTGTTIRWCRSKAHDGSATAGALSGAGSTTMNIRPKTRATASGSPIPNRTGSIPISKRN